MASHSYLLESQALDAEILSVIERWRCKGEALSDAAFEDLALRLCAYQRRYNEPYARYCAALDSGEPQSWEEIPAVPAAGFKEAAVTTFPPADAALVFETSGTTRGRPGRHFMETATLYDAALEAGFDRFVLADGAQLRYLNLVPSPADRPASSLGYMMARVARERGCGRTGWYVHGEHLDFDGFVADARAASASGQRVCIAATAFALAHLLEAMEAGDITIALPPGSRAMETGGFKGRTRSVERADLYAGIADRLGIAEHEMFSEYGMTELTSQYYARGTNGTYGAPAWLRVRVVGPDRRTRPHGEIGALLHLDLANRASCIAVQTEDLGMMTNDGLALLGRDAEAPLRGCSLDAELLALRRRFSPA